ncbi:hypothetical protein HYX08_03925 [Candidatus Woesearchaeota archaeon]|nr:hypothetical protein [Candidatus Woesearchaeota archaeon]
MGFLDFFSILAYAFVILVFYLLIKLTLGKATFQIPEESGNVADTISLINILKTPVEINNSKMSIAELIALSRFDSSKNQLAEKSIMQIMDDYFGNKCSIFCIDGEKLKSRGCSSLQHFGCSENVISVPAYGAAIEVAFKSDIAQPSTKNIPLK